MEHNFHFLSSCRIFVGTHFVAEVVLVSHVTKKWHRKYSTCKGVVVFTHPLVCWLYCIYFDIQVGVTIAVR